MNEIRAIIHAFDEAHGAACALATVVSVEGSAYRRPGARMLVPASGAAAGMISAGCLENDVVAHARQVIETGAVKLVEYDTTSTSDEMAWGLGLGCNGVVRVLIEPLLPGSSHLAALRESLAAQANGVIATVFQHPPSDAAPVVIGSRCFIDEYGNVHCDINDAELAASIADDAQTARRHETSSVRVYQTPGGTAKVFIEIVAPPVPLVVFGAGNDAVPVIDLAHGLGWRTEIVDPQARELTHARFPQAEKVTLARPATIAQEVTLTPRTLTLLMTHNYDHDRELLEFLLLSPVRHISVLGPRKRTERMLGELVDAGYTLRDDDHARLFAPAGLDIGAHGPQEIALAVIAEMRAVLAARKGGSLRLRRTGIHDTQTILRLAPARHVDAAQVTVQRDRHSQQRQ